MRRNVEGAQLGHMIGRVIRLVFAYRDAPASLPGFDLEHRLRSAPLGRSVGQRSHHFPDGEKDFTGNDLYLDNGRYYFGATRAELKRATKQDGEYDLVVKA